MQISLKWEKLKFSVSIKVEPQLTNLYGGLDCHIVELPRSPSRRSRVRWSFCDRYKQCDGVSKAKAAIRRTIVKRLTPYVERRMGSTGKQILCKLFAAQKSAKIDAQGMKGTWGDLVFCTALLRNQGSSMSIIQLNGVGRTLNDHFLVATPPALYHNQKSTGRKSCA